MFPPVEGMQISTRNLLRDQMERYMLYVHYFSSDPPQADKLRADLLLS
jgi:hypothetical protein